MHRSISLAMIALLFPLGCHSSMAPPKPQPMPMPVSANPPQRFENQPAGIAFTYPAGWKAGDATAVKFKFDGPGNGASKPQLTLDVPALPFHFGILPLDQVCSGYVDDAKKTMPDLQVTNLPDPTLPDAKQHRFKLTGHKDGKPSINEAVVLVHADKVFILSIDCDDKSYAGAKAALDQAVGSLQWIK